MKTFAFLSRRSMQASAECHRNAVRSRMTSLVALLLMLLVVAEANAATILSHGPVIGGLTTANAKVFVRTADSVTGLPVRAPVSVRYSDNPDLANYFESAGETSNPAVCDPNLGFCGDGTAILDLAFLAAACYRNNALCYYTVTISAIEAIPPPYPAFRTLPGVGEAVDGLKFVVIPDTSTQAGPEYGVGPAFLKAKDEGAVMAILPGDFDHHNRKTIADKREQNRLLYDPVTTGRDFAQMARFTPIARSWDDHDYGDNNADGKDSILSGPDKGLPYVPNGFPFKCESIHVYVEYTPAYALTATPSDVCRPQFQRKPNASWPQHLTWPVTLPAGIWQSFKVGQVKVILLDTRTQRNRKSSERNLLTAFTLEGQHQRDWLYQRLTEPDPSIVWRVIVSSSVWNRTLEKDEAWPFFDILDRDPLIDFIRTNQVKNVVLVGGDVHWAALDDGTHGGKDDDDPPCAGPGLGCIPSMVAGNTNMKTHSQCPWRSAWAGATDPTGWDVPGSKPWGVKDDEDQGQDCPPTGPDTDPDQKPHWVDQQDPNKFDDLHCPDPPIYGDGRCGIFNGYGVLTFRTTPSHSLTMEIKNHWGVVRRTLTITAQ